MQSRDGGWGAFDVDNTRTLIAKLPFCDFGAVTDPPSADVTAHVLETLAYAATARATRRGAASTGCAPPRRPTARGSAAGASTTSTAPARCCRHWSPPASTPPSPSAAPWPGSRPPERGGGFGEDCAPTATPLAGAGRAPPRRPAGRCSDCTPPASARPAGARCASSSRPRPRRLGGAVLHRHRLPRRLLPQLPPLPGRLPGDGARPLCREAPRRPPEGGEGGEWGGAARRSRGGAMSDLLIAAPLSIERLAVAPRAAGGSCVPGWARAAPSRRCRGSRPPPRGRSRSSASAGRSTARWGPASWSARASCATPRAARRLPRGGGARRRAPPRGPARPRRRDRLGAAPGASATRAGAWRRGRDRGRHGERLAGPGRRRAPVRGRARRRRHPRARGPPAAGDRGGSCARRRARRAVRPLEVWAGTAPAGATVEASCFDVRARTRCPSRCARATASAGTSPAETPRRRSSRCSSSSSRCSSATSPARLREDPVARPLLSQRMPVAQAVDADRMRRADGLDRRRRAAGPPRDRHDRAELIARKKFVYLCTNGLLLGKKLDLHAVALLRLGRAPRRDARAPRRASSAKGPSTRPSRRSARRSRRASASTRTRPSSPPTRPRPSRCPGLPQRRAQVDQMMISPAYAYEKAPDQEHFPGVRRPASCSARHSPVAGAGTGG